MKNILMSLLLAGALGTTAAGLARISGDAEGDVRPEAALTGALLLITAAIIRHGARIHRLK